MTNPFNNSEFGGLPEEYPVLRELDAPPVEEGMPTAEGYAPETPSPAPETAPPAPEITQPGSFEPDEGREKRHILRKFMYYAAAAAIMFVAFRPLGLFTKAATSTPETPAVEGYADKPGDPGDPGIHIWYAMQDGGKLLYSYVVYPGENMEIDMDTFGWASPVSIDAMAVDTSGGKAYPEQNPDVWEGSRSIVDFEMDIAQLTGDKLLVLTGTFTVNGVEKEIVAVKNVVPKPPAPDTGATVSVTVQSASEASMDYHAYFTQAHDDKNEYELTPIGFWINCFDAAGEPCGGPPVWSTYEEEVDENGEKVTVWNSVDPDISRDGRTWNFDYSGPCEIFGVSDQARTYTVSLFLMDEKTGLRFDIETEPQEIPGYIGQDVDPVEPVCDITAYAVWSEMYALMSFSDMQTADKVTLEMWDPHFNTLEWSMDITADALDDLEAFSPEMLSTDIFYENHQDYYSQPGVSFPMEAEFHVVIDYNGYSDQVTYVANTTSEAGFYAKYAPESDIYAGEYAGTVAIGSVVTLDVPEIDIVIDEPEKVTGQGILSLSASFNGVPLDRSAYDIRQSTYSTYFSGSDEPVETLNTDIIIRRPAGASEGTGDALHIEMTQMLSTGEIIVRKIDIPFTLDYEH